jgi:GT2 family glycosyltransferase
MDSSICIVTVTYGNRKKFVESSIESAMKCENVKRIILVDNNSNFNESYVKNTKKPDAIKVVKNEKNLGSSGGFKKGIEEYLVDPKEDFVLFLDDDNVLRDNTIKQLLISYKKIDNNSKNIGLLCVREEMKKYWLIASGKLSPNILKNYSPFARFSIFDVFSKLLYRYFSKKNSKMPYENEPIEVDNGYWSGLFITKETILNSGLPNEDFFVYKDDHEYIYNLRKNGLKLFLIPSAQLTEMDKSWATVSSKTIFSFPEMSGPEFRAYYSIRNTVYFEEHVLKDKSFFRYINKNIYLFILYVSLYFVDKSRYKLLIGAINDGVNKKMGENENIHY